MTEYITEHRGDFELIQRAQVKRARRIAIVFGVISGTTMIAIVYGFLQHEMVIKQAKQIDSLKIELQKRAK